MTTDLDRLLVLRTTGTKPPLYCVHAVSGSAYSYTGLSRLLGDEQPVYGFEAPGFDNDRTPVRSLPALADEYTAILREVHPEGPYRLLGWSMGGVIGFEMARRLVAAGEKVESLILVDSGLCPIAPLPPEREILRRFIRDMMGLSGQAVPQVDHVFDRWPEDVDPDVVFPAVEAAGILPEDMDADLLAEQYAVFRAHLEAFYAFEIADTYHGPVVHIKAAESDPDELHWERVTTDLEEHTLAGTHHTIWTGESLTALAEIVRRSLG